MVTAVAWTALAQDESEKPTVFHPAGAATVQLGEVPDSCMWLTFVPEPSTILPPRRMISNSVSGGFPEAAFEGTPPLRAKARQFKDAQRIHDRHPEWYAEEYED